MAKAVHETFCQTFPTFKDKFCGTFKKDLYKHVIELFVGDWFSFDFHVEMIRTLFGDTEVRDLTRVKIRNESVYVDQPEMSLLDSDLKRLKRLVTKANESSPDSGRNEDTEH